MRGIQIPKMPFDVSKISSSFGTGSQILHSSWNVQIFKSVMVVLTLIISIWSVVIVLKLVILFQISVIFLNKCLLLLYSLICLLVMLHEFRDGALTINFITSHSTFVYIKPIALKITKTQQSFEHSECIMVKTKFFLDMKCLHFQNTHTSD